MCTYVSGINLFQNEICETPWTGRDIDNIGSPQLMKKNEDFPANFHHFILHFIHMAIP